jgi:hypothetical protein
MTAKHWLCCAAVIVACGCGGSSTSPSTTASSTDTFSSLLTSGGESSHQFTITQSGTITVTLQSVSPATAVGFGIGVPAAGPCSLSSSMVADAGATGQIALQADAGTYCAAVYDPGTVTNFVTFTLTVQHP